MKYICKFLAIASFRVLFLQEKKTKQKTFLFVGQVLHLVCGF